MEIKAVLAKGVSCRVFGKQKFFQEFVLFNNNFTENCRPQRDSNSDRRSRRPARWPFDHHHGPRSIHVWLLGLSVVHFLILKIYMVKILSWDTFSTLSTAKLLTYISVPPWLSGFVCSFHPAAPGFESQEHHLCFLNLYLNCIMWKRRK